MIRLTITALIMVCIAVAAGCGKGSSTTVTSTVPKYNALSNFTTATGILIGGNVQNGPFALKQSNYSTVTSPAFSHRSSAFAGPISIATDGANSYYVANFDAHNILKIYSSGRVTKFAGTGIAGFGNHSTAYSSTTAAFNAPKAITTTDGSVFYIADSGNNAIRKIDASGMVSVLAGDGSAGSDDTDTTSLTVVARFSQPSGVAVVGKYVFVADTNNHTIRMIDTTDVGRGKKARVTTLAGSPGSPGSADGDRKIARFNQPARITTDGSNLYVTDFGNRTVRRINLGTGFVDTIAGVAGMAGTTNGPKGASLFNWPDGIATDGVNLYVTDFYSGEVRRIELGGTNVTTTILTGDSPIGIVTNGSGLYIAERYKNSIIRIK